MTEEEKKYTCMHDNEHKQRVNCPLCISECKEREIKYDKDMKRIDAMRADMKSLGFKHARDYLNHKAREYHRIG